MFDNRGSTVVKLAFPRLLSIPDLLYTLETVLNVCRRFPLTLQSPVDMYAPLALAY
jgi:hypothetical protein